MAEWPAATVATLQREGVLLVEDGNHGEYRPRPDEFCADGVAFIRAADIADGSILFKSSSKINECARQRITKGIGVPGDVLLSHKGTVGRVALVPDNAPPFVCSPQTTFWRTLNQAILDRKYLHVFLRSPYFRAQLDARASETDMAPYVSLTSQRGLYVILPPIDTQYAIGSIICALDDKIEVNRRMNETLEAMARALFKDWFVDFGPTRAKMEGRPPYLATDIWALFPERLDDEEKPEGWLSVPAREMLEHNPPEPLQRGVAAPYLDMAALPLSGSWSEGPVLREFTAGTRFRNGDALLARITPCLENGKTAFVQNLPEDTVGWGSTEFIVLRSRPPMPLAYAYIVARSPEFRDRAIQSMTGTSGRQRVQVDSLAECLLTKPDHETAAAFDDVVSPLFSKVATNAREAETLAATRDLLLPKLMSGEIRIKEAERIAEAAL